MVTLVSELQLRNAKSPMLVTLEGIVTLVSELQLKNALSPMLVTDFPSIIAGISAGPTASSG